MTNVINQLTKLAWIESMAPGLSKEMQAFLEQSVRRGIQKPAINYIASKLPTEKEMVDKADAHELVNKDSGAPRARQAGYETSIPIER